jgi:hypothetical protein
LPKSAQVFGVQVSQASLTQTCPAPHGLQDLLTPQPRSSGAQPGTAPLSKSALQVVGVQQPPSSHTSLMAQVPQDTADPQPLLTLPQVARPHAGGVHGVHIPPEHLFAPAQPPQLTLPLPQAFCTEPHRAIPPASHSGAGAAHTPPTH